MTRKLPLQTGLPDVELRKPISTDGAAVHALIDRCKPLDTNSMYCNLLQCSHFADTCVLAERDHQVVGFTSGYLIPGRENVLFVWQIAVDQSMRGKKLAKHMLHQLLARPETAKVTFIETTITPSNGASIALFEKLAESLSANIQQSVMFSREQHFAGKHDDEMLFRIGPFDMA